MDATLHQLGSLLIQAIPTIVFFTLVTAFLKQVYFKPIARVLEERRKATEGARELARQAFEAADRKTSEFERALQLARNELHQEHEAMRARWEEEQARRLAEVRTQAEAQIQDARRVIAEEAEQARAQLSSEAAALSDRIIDVVSKRRAA